MNPARRALLFDSLATLSLGVSACAPSQKPKRFTPRPLAYPAGEVTVYLRQYKRDERIEAALPGALRVLTKSGLMLRKNSEIWVHKDVASFTQHSKQNDPDLRAYSRYAIVHVLPLRYWGQKSKEVVAKRLVHELTHLALFQSLGRESDARTIRPPFWFREGMASVIAEQGNQRMPLNLVVKALAGRDPLKVVEARSTPSALRYGIAHHLAAALHKDSSTPAWKRWIEHASQNPHAGNIEASYETLSAKTIGGLWSLTLKLNANEE